MSEDEPTPGEPPQSFEARLLAARQRRGLEPNPPAPTAEGDAVLHASALSIGLRVGVELVSALVVGVGIGYGLDWLLGTRPVLTAVFVLLGGAAGVLNVWRMFAPRTKAKGTN
jgi:ATP synthase protein I